MNDDTDTKARRTSRGTRPEVLLMNGECPTGGSSTGIIIRLSDSRTRPQWSRFNAAPDLLSDSWTVVVVQLANRD